MRAHSTIVGLDVLRLCAALFVVFYHIFFYSWVEPRGDGGLSDAIGMRVRFLAAVPYCSWGWIGVDLFFVISGFVITMSAHGRRPVDFAIGRFSRLYPALLFFALLTFCIVLLAHILPIRLAVLALLRTLVLLPKGPWIDGVIWTLTIEAIFYGMIFISLFGQSRRRLLRGSRWAMFGLGLFWAAVLYADTTGGLGLPVAGLQHIAAAYWARVAFISTGSFFLVGIFGYEAYHHGFNLERGLCLVASILTSLVVIYHTALYTQGITEFHQSALVPGAVWLMMSALCALSVLAERHYKPGRKLRAAARQLGLLTYPLYLVHDIPGGFLLGKLYRLGINPWVAAALTILAAIIASYLFVRLIEPGLRSWLGIEQLKNWRRRQLSLAIAPVPAKL